MPTIVGFKKSTFDPEKYRQAVCDNHGQTLTTDGICSGIAQVEQDIADGKNDWLAAIKETPAYIAEANDA